MIKNLNNCFVLELKVHNIRRLVRKQKRVQKTEEKKTERQKENETERQKENKTEKQKENKTVRVGCVVVGFGDLSRLGFDNDLDLNEYGGSVISLHLFILVGEIDQVEVEIINL